MAFDYSDPAYNFAGIAATQAAVSASIQANWAGPVPGPEAEGSIHRNTHNPRRQADIAAYNAAETPDD